MSKCCFSASYSNKPYVLKQQAGELEYVPKPDKILTALQYRAKLERNRKAKTGGYSL